MNETMCVCVADGEVELLNAINVPLHSDMVSFTHGMDGFPAFEFTLESNVFRQAPDIVQRIGPDFSIYAVVNPRQVATGGFLFAVVDASNTFVQFGLRLSAPESDYRQAAGSRGPGRSRRNVTLVSLYYADSQPQGAISGKKTICLLTHVNIGTRFTKPVVLLHSG